MAVVLSNCRRDFAYPRDFRPSAFRYAVPRRLLYALRAINVRRLLPYVGLVLFLAALYLIYSELRGFRYADVIAYLRAIPLWKVGAALGLTVANYALLTVYDWLAIKYVRANLPYRKSALAAAIGYSFSIALGHAYLTGGAVRYRLYSAWGISGSDIARIIVFCGMSFWIGYTALGGLLFTLAPFPLPPELRMPFSLRPLGVALLAILIGYLALSAVRHKPLKAGDWSFEIPNLRLTVGQGVVASIDMLLSSSILFILLPSTPEVTLLQVVAVFLVATIAGYISQVPGGLGVFDGVVLLVLTPQLDAASVLGALLAFRSIFYLLPLLAGASTFGVVEAVRYGDRMQVMSRRVRRAVPRVVPTVLALLVFMTGTLVLIAGALPAEPHRIEWISERLPLGFYEVLHATSGIVGIALLFLAMSLNRRMEAAFTGAQVGLMLAFVLSLLRGGWEEAFAIAFVALALAPCRSFFYRRSSLLSQPLATGFVAGVVAVVVSAWWLGLLVYGDAILNPAILWQAGWDGDGGRFARMLATAAIAGVFLVIGHVLYPAPAGGQLLTDTNLPTAQTLVREAPDPLSTLVLHGDKYLLFTDDQAAMVTYGIRGRTWVALGDPIGPKQHAEDLIWQMRMASQREGGRLVFYQVGRAFQRTYLETGLGLFQVGDVGRVWLGGGGQKGRLTDMISEVDLGEQLSFSVIPPEGLAVHLSNLRDLSDDWREIRGTGEKAFAMGNFEEDFIARFPLAIVRRGGRIIAFSTLLTTHRELAIDLVRISPEAPAGTIEYLFVRTSEWAQRNGSKWLNLGLAPLDNAEDRLVAPLWMKPGELLYPHGEHFPDARAIRSFKEQFDPKWSPRYIAAPTGIELPGVLRDVAALISGGVRGAI
jgi:phosphatidylglycerol lysyltransferase